MDNLVIRTVGGPAAQELVRKIKARAPRLICIGCGSRDFGLLEEPDKAVRTLLIRESTDGTFPQFRTTQFLATLLCTNCGQVYQFAEAVLDGAKPSDYGKVSDG